MKDCFRIVFCSLFVMIMSINANALSYYVPDKIKIGEHYYFIDYDMVVFAEADHCINGVVDIPQTIFYQGKEYPVRCIAEYAFGLKGIQAVRIPNSVTAICINAFGGCRELKTVYIPASVEILDAAPVHPWVDNEGLFNGCDSLSKIVVDKNNKYYDSRNDCNGVVQSSTNKLLAGCRTTIIPSDVSSVGMAAFSGCKGLTNMTIPSGIQIIGSNAFSGCIDLTSITIPSSVKGMGVGAFKDCKSLKSINIQDGIRKINKKAFSGCIALDSIKIPSSVKVIASRAFYGCEGLKSINIPDSIRKIAEDAFEGCTGFTGMNTIVETGARTAGMNISKGSASLTTHVRLDELDSGAIDEFAAGMTSITIPSNKKKIAPNALKGCADLTSITIPSSVTEIGAGAFEGCTSLTSITMYPSVREIGPNAFDGCANLTNLTIPVHTYGLDDKLVNLIQTLSKLTNINTINTINACLVRKGDLWYQLYKHNLKADVVMLCSPTQYRYIVIPKTLLINDSVYNINQINKKLFSDCTEITSIVIPSSVTHIGDSAFSGCTSLKSITIPSGIEEIKPYTFSGCINLEEISMSKGLKAIGEGAFQGCSKLKTVTLPKSVVSIGEGAFYGCYSLSSFIIPKKVTQILQCTFYGCNSLESILIPKKIDYVDCDAFTGCCNLKSIIVDKNNKMYDSRNNCNAIVDTEYNNLVLGCVNTIIPNNIDTISAAAFARNTNIETVKIPTSVKCIASGAFAGCTGLTSITIPSSVQKIGDYAFANCTGLASITIPSSVQEIGSDAFQDCTGLASIEIPSSVQKIGKGAFKGCQLDSIIVEEGNKEYDSRNNCNAIIETKQNKLFVGCKNTIIPEDIIAIGDESFINCFGLKSITIPQNARTVGHKAFEGCRSLSEVILPSTLTFDKIENGAFGECNSLNTIVITSGNDKTLVSDAASLREHTIKVRRDSEYLYKRIFGNNNDIILYVPQSLAGDFNITPYDDDFLEIIQY